jgi:hypothetical protein
MCWTKENSVFLNEMNGAMISTEKHFRNTEGAQIIRKFSCDAADYRKEKAL